MSPLLVETAKQLGFDKKIMCSHWAYHKRGQNRFFSPNPNLGMAQRMTMAIMMARHKGDGTIKFDPIEKQHVKTYKKVQEWF